MLTPDVFWFPFPCARGAGRAKVFKSRRSVLFHTDSPSSQILAGGRAHVTRFGVKVDFSYKVEVRGKGTVVCQKLGGAERHDATQKH